MSAQIALWGKDRATSGRCVCSFSINTMTSPRSASRETNRVIRFGCGAMSTTGAPERGLSTSTLWAMRTPHYALNLHCKSCRIRTDVPLPAREIGKFLRSAILRDRCFTQRSRRAPCGRIVDIDIGRQTTLQAVHQPVIHDVVHSAVTAHLPRQVSSRFPERMLILVAIAVDVLPLLLALAIKKNTRRIVREGALGTHNRVQAAVRTGADNVMLQENGAAFQGLDDAGVHVAADVFLRALGVALGKILLDETAQRSLGRAYRNHVVEPVAPVNVHVMRHRAQSMGGIDIAITLHMRNPAPQALSLG